MQSNKTLWRDLALLKSTQDDWQFKILKLPGGEFSHHPVEREFLNFESPQFKKALNQTIINRPDSFEKLLMTKGVGPKTIRAISLVAEVIYGAKPSYEDPARYTFAHGGKDGTPYPVNRKVYDESLAIIEKAIRQTAGLTLKEKSQASWRAEKALGH